MEHIEVSVGTKVFESTTTNSTSTFKKHNMAISNLESFIEKENIEKANNNDNKQLKNFKGNKKGKKIVDIVNHNLEHIEVSVGTRVFESTATNSTSTLKKHNMTISNVESSNDGNKKNTMSEIRSFLFALNSSKFSFLVGLSYSNPYSVLKEAHSVGSDEVIVDDYMVFNEITDYPISLKIGERVPF